MFVEFFINRFLPLREGNSIFCEVGKKFYAIIWVSFRMPKSFLSEAANGRSIIVEVHARYHNISFEIRSKQSGNGTREFYHGSSALSGEKHATIAPYSSSV